MSIATTKEQLIKNYEAVNTTCNNLTLTVHEKEAQIQQLEASLKDEKLRHQSNLEDYQKRIQELRGETKQYQDSNHSLCIERNKLLKELQSLRKDWAELSGHHKAQLMSVYYLLDTCMHHGNHTEKRVSMQHLKLTIEKLIANGDDLRNTLEGHLPF